MFKSVFFIYASIPIAMTVWGCGGGSEPSPWPQEQAESAITTVYPVIAIGTNAAADALGESSSFNVAAEIACAEGGRVAISGELSGGVSGDVVNSTFTMDMDFLGCGSDGSTIDGALRHTERSRVDTSTNEVQVSGSSEGTLEFAGALIGACRIDTSWSVDIQSGQLTLTGSACGNSVDMSILPPAPGNDLSWDLNEAEEVAEEALALGDIAAVEVSVADRTASGTVEVDISETTWLCREGDARITGTVTSDEQGSVYDLRLELDQCEGFLQSVTGSFAYTRSELVDLESGAFSLEETLSGELDVDDPRYPNSSCTLDVVRTIEPDTGTVTITGRACGHDVDFTFP